MRRLNQLKPGESGTVTALQGDGPIYQRLLEMGVIEGVAIEVVRIAPLGDPIEISVQGYHLSLRKAEAAYVQLDA